MLSRESVAELLTFKKYLNIRANAYAVNYWPGRYTDGKKNKDEPYR